MGHQRSNDKQTKQNRCIKKNRARHQRMMFFPQLYEMSQWVDRGDVCACGESSLKALSGHA